jgi:hypothetical protein
LGTGLGFCAAAGLYINVTINVAAQSKRVTVRSCWGEWKVRRSAVTV